MFTLEYAEPPLGAAEGSSDMSTPGPDVTTAFAQLAGYHLGSAQRAAEAALQGAAEFWTGAVTRRTGPAELAVAGLRWWETMLDRAVPQWHRPNEIVFSTPFAQLRDFTPKDADPSAPGTDSDTTGDTAGDVVPTLILPPQAGHASTVVDFSPEQSQVATLQEAGLRRLFVCEWLPATADTREVTITDYIDVIDAAIDHMGGRANLVGDCQGGWLAAIYAALRPERVNTLTLAGAPIDFHAGESVIASSTRVLTAALGLAPYRALVAAGGGNMPGAAVLANFVMIAPQSEVSRQLQLLAHLDDAEHVQRYRAFEDWFKHTQDIPGAFYLWLVEHLFTRNELIRGELVVDGRPVDLGAITCPLFLLAGAGDHITPPAQLFAAADAVGTPASEVTKRTAAGGHLGLFMGREALRTDWPPLMRAVRAHSDR